MLMVNLLDDHLVDILLDSAASGWNTVEREGFLLNILLDLYLLDQEIQKKENYDHNY